MHSTFSPSGFDTRGARAKYAWREALLWLVGTGLIVSLSIMGLLWTYGSF